MVRFLDAGMPDFEARFGELLDAKRESSSDVAEAVRAIVADVRRRGDAALFDLSERFDRVDLSRDGLAIGPGEVDGAISRVERQTREALEVAHERIRAHHERQLPVDLHHSDALEVELGQRWTAIEAAGLYVPGGTASYPSSVLMNAVPAKVAGVERLAMVVPTPDGVVNPLVLLAARIAGVDEIYRVGGAQAVAALAYGTRTIAPVAKIVGPGNAYVAEAKRQVFGKVGIDMIAGPSEVLVIADGGADARILAADLLAQAEHDADAQSILMTDDRALAERVAKEVEAQLATLPRAEIASASWRNNGAIIVLESLEQAPALADRIAPEHLELALARPQALAACIRNAGAIFLGHETPEVIGDYVGGTNHVLPTARSARFSSGLGVLDFMKRTALLELDAKSLAVLGPAAVTLARAEGLEGHARSVLYRLERDGGSQ
ncbi:MAG: histidinol dehydrogenase [Rhizobiales bacterium]|nr:histidinol dehydrogenase [Hyphomicrobiales bacterium]